MNRPPSDVEIAALISANLQMLNRLLPRIHRNKQPLRFERAHQLTLDMGTSHAERFLRTWLDRRTSYPVSPCRSVDLYAAFTGWCDSQAIEPGPLRDFALTAINSFGCSKRRIRCRPDASGTVLQAVVVFPPGMGVTMTRTVLNPQLAEFAAAARAGATVGKRP